MILDPTTGEVLVPASDYHNSRIMLAAQGLPASVPEGYSGLNDMPMGTSVLLKACTLNKRRN